MGDDREAAPDDLYDFDAERALLGAMLRDPAAISIAAAQVGTAKDFGDAQHVQVAEAVFELWRGDNEPTILSTRTALVETGAGKSADLLPFLHDLEAAAAVDEGEIKHAAAQIAELARRRRFASLGYKVRAAAQSGTPADEIAASVTAHVDAILGGGRAGELTMDGAALIEEAFDAIQEAASRTGIPGLTTGSADLDRITGVWRPGQFIVIGGRPGIGKSIAAVDFTRAALFKENAGTLVISLEMQSVEYTNRLLSAESGVHLSKLTMGRLDESDWERLALVAPSVTEAPLRLAAGENLTVTEIVALAKEHARAFETQQQHLGLVVIDYLQLIQPENTQLTRQQSIGEITRALKRLSKSLKCPVIALSALNRGAADRPPHLHDLRESGDIESDADIVILLHREDAEDPEHERAGEIDFDFAKHRGGVTQKVTKVHQYHLARTVDIGNP